MARRAAVGRWVAAESAEEDVVRGAQAVLAAAVALATAVEPAAVASEAAVVWVADRAARIQP